MCLTFEKCSSHVGKRVKLEQNMWATCEHMWATCARIQCDLSIGAGPLPPLRWGKSAIKRHRRVLCGRQTRGVAKEGQPTGLQCRAR